MLLDLWLTNTKELIGEVKISGSLHCSDQVLVELMIWKDIGQVNSIVKTQNLRKVNFRLFKELVDGTPWKLPSGIKKQKRAGSSLKTFFLEHKNY